MAEAAQQSDDWRDISPAETQASPYAHGDDWHDIAPPASLDEFAGPKITETPLYKAGEAVQKFGRETFPVSEEERAAHPYASAIGRGVGSMLPAAVGTLVAGPAGALAGAAQMGMSSGADVFDDALSKGATEEQAAKAAGATGALSAAIGVLPLGAILAPIRQKLPGMAGWAVAKLTQAAVNGVTFATVGEAQQWLTTEVEKAYYDPNAHYDPQLKDMLASFVVGGAFGTMHPLHRPGEAPGQPAEVPPLEGEVLLPERGPPSAGLGAREAPIIEGEAVGAPTAAEGRPEGLPPPARALPPPAETAPAATRESLKETLDRNAPLDELVQHPYVRHVDEQNKKAVPTGTEEDFVNPEWRAQRVYDFNVKGFGSAATTEPVQGWDAAVDRLTDRAKLYAGPEGVENGKRAIIVLGPPASGKSSTSEPLARAFRAAIVDSDDAKLVIPEYRGGLGTQAVHEESSYIAKDVLGRVLDDGANVVLPKVGYSADKINNQINGLKELGYKVDLVHVAATPEISGRRNIERLYKTGRLVPPDFIAGLGDKPRETYHLLKGEADGFADIDTTSWPGETREASPGLADALPDGRNFVGDHAASDNRGREAQAGAREEAQVGQIGPHRVTAADGTAIDVAPRVVEAGRVLTSQDQGYDPTLQPRQRSRAASQAQVRDIATNLDPERLGYSAEADRGAPIIGPDGMVESGNGRVLALRHVYDQNAPQAQTYRDWLSRQGVDVSKFRNPILVRQRTTPFTPEQRRAFTVAANQPTTLAMSASERAMADARLIDANSLNLIVNSDDLSRNHDFVHRFVGQLPQTEQGAMTDARGALSSEGAARVRNAVLAKAYGDAGVLTRIAESTNDEIKSISNALVAAAPRWAKMRAGIEAGSVRRDVDATPDLIEAVRRTADIRAKGQKLNEYLAQIDAFDKLPDTVEGFMRNFYDPKGRRGASAERIRDALRFYADEASKVSADKGLDLGLVKVEPRDILRLAQKKGWEGLPVGRPEEPDAGKMLSVANKVASEWQDRLGPDIKVVMGGSLVSRTYVRSRGDEPIDMDIRFLTDNPERDYPKVEAVTGLKLKKSRPMDNYPSGSATGYLVEGPLTRDGITFDVEAAVRTPAYVGWARFYPAVMTPDELAAFRADKARLKGDKEAYKALKASVLKEVMKRVEERGGPWEMERELYGRQGRDAERGGAGAGAGQPAGGAQAPGPFLTAGGEGFGGEGAEGDQEAAVRAQRPERVIGPSLPGFEPVSSAEVAKRRANEPLRPRVAQEPPSGLFAHQGQQLSLEDFIDQVSDVKAQRPEESAAEREERQRKFNEMVAANKEEVATIRRELENFDAHPRYELVHGDKRILASKNIGGDGAPYRITSFDSHGPSGHFEVRDLDEMARELRGYRKQGYLRPEEEEQKLLSDLPEGAVFKEGRGPLGRGKFFVELGGKMLGNLQASKVDAVKEAKQRLANEEFARQSATDRERRRAALEAKIRGGGEITDADLKFIGLRTGSSDLRWFIPAAADLFKISSRAVRPLIADLIRQGSTDFGTKREYVSPRQGLAAIAKTREASRVPTGWGETEGRGEPQGQKIRIGRDTYAYVNPKYSAKEQEIANAVMEIGARMAPKASIKGVAALRQSDSPIWGGFINSAAFPQLITWSLEKGGADQIGQTVRHEIIHHLRNMGLFSPDEWKALRDAAVHDGWLQRHNIYERYPDLSADHKVEEAVAEQFGKWRAERSLVKPGLIRDAFMRLELFLRRVAAATRRVLGFNATPSDIFTRIETGELGRRSVSMNAKKEAAQRIEAYHGSSAMFDKFDMAHAGTATDAGFLGHGLYFSTDQSVSEPYPHKYKAQIDLRNPLHLSMPDFRTDKRNLVRDALDLPKSASAKDVTSEAVKRGYDGIVLDYSPTGYNHKEIAVFDKSRVSKPIKRASGGRVDTRKASHYSPTRGTDARHCSNCTMFRKPHACTAVSGFIAKPGLCDWYEGGKEKTEIVQRAGGGRVVSHYIDRNPSEAQKSAGNYRKAHINVHGLDIAIENAKGHERAGVGKDGKPWSVTMPAHYGYIKRTEGADGDHVDCYVGPHIKSRKVFVIDQHDADTKSFDEHKCMLGFASEKQARDTYHRGFSDGRGKERLGHLTEMSIDRFKHWLADDTESPVKGTAHAPKIDTAHDVAVMSEMSKPGDVYYRDRSLPARIINNGKWLPIDEPLKRHEVAEYNAIKKMVEEFEAKHGRKPNDAEREAIYLKCHKEHGEVAEHAYLRENGYDVKAWESWCRGKLAHLEHKRIAKPVPNPHVRPSPHDRRRLEAAL
jgi:hypothetical protein